MLEFWIGEKIIQLAMIQSWNFFTYIFSANMATVFNRLSYIALRHTSRIPVRRKHFPPIPQPRSFHSSPLLLRAEDDGDVDDAPKSTRQPFKFSVSGLDPEVRKAYKASSPEERQQWEEDAEKVHNYIDPEQHKAYYRSTPQEQKQWLEDATKMHDYMTSPQIESELSAAVSQAVQETQDESPHTEIEIPRIRPGFFAMGEDEEQDSGEDEEFEGDDISSLGHANLEQHREMREYARIMAWEMPLLSSKPHPQSLHHTPSTNLLKTF